MIGTRPEIRAVALATGFLLVLLSTSGCVSSLFPQQTSSTPAACQLGPGPTLDATSVHRNPVANGSATLTANASRLSDRVLEMVVEVGSDHQDRWLTLADPGVRVVTGNGTTQLLFRVNVHYGSDQLRPQPHDPRLYVNLTHKVEPGRYAVTGCLVKVCDGLCSNGSGNEFGRAHVLHLNVSVPG